MTPFFERIVLHYYRSVCVISYSIQFPIIKLEHSDWPDTELKQGRVNAVTGSDDRWSILFRKRLHFPPHRSKFRHNSLPLVKEKQACAEEQTTWAYICQTNALVFLRFHSDLPDTVKERD